MANTSPPFSVGIADAVPKVIAYRLLEPAMQIEEPLRLNCREGRLDLLLAELALHKLDVVIADRPLGNHLSIRAYNHLLGKCGLTIFGTAALAKKFAGKFPQRLQGAPFLILVKMWQFKPRFCVGWEITNCKR